MKIKFYGPQGIEDAADNLASILNLFKQRYGISSFKNLELSLDLCDTDGQEVELVDATTSEILGTFEVYQSGEFRERFTAKNDKHTAELKLVVDNTK